LDQNGLSTDRTVYELWCALEALDRLDREAEEHCRNFAATQDDQNINPHLSGNDVYSNDFNGFFMRDDMPKSFVQDNLSHFSRPGNCSPVICCNGSIIGRRTDVMGATWSSQHPNVPWYPTEMSIDQVSELYKGLALVVKFLPSNVQYSGTSIKTKAQDAILRITYYISEPPVIQPACPPVSVGSFPWLVVNPLNLSCVYGVNESKYHTAPPYDLIKCEDAGGYSASYASGIAEGLDQIGASWSLTDQNKICVLKKFSVPFDPIFQGQQFGYMIGNCKSDANLHAATIASISNSWRIKPPGPMGSLLPQWLWPNITKQMVEFTSVRCDLRFPHLPLIYRIFHGGSMLHPENLPYNISSYVSRLDLAPQCGIYNYTKKGYGYSNYEWSSDDRLTESGRRGDMNQDRETVGLDYMLLFNLYLANDGGYATFYKNPYYEVNHNHTYPYVENGITYASHSSPGQENYLEYLSAISHVLSSGDITYRGAKVIDLLPGFTVDYGGTFLGYIRDFICCNAPYNNPNPNNPFNFKMSDGAVDPFVMDSLNGVPFKAIDIPQPIQEQYYATEEELRDDSLYWRNEIVKTGDSAAIKFTNAFWSTTEQNFDQNVELKVYPNPANNHFTLDFSSAGDFLVRIYNSTGKKVFETSITESKHYEINSSSWPTGTYVISVIGNAQHFVSKINILK